MAAWDVTDELFWPRLCEIHRRGRIVDGITEPLDHDTGHLGIGGFEKPEVENRLRRFQGEGLVKIDGRIYRLTAQAALSNDTQENETRHIEQQASKEKY